MKKILILSALILFLSGCAFKIKVDRSWKLETIRSVYGMDTCFVVGFDENGNKIIKCRRF